MLARELYLRKLYNGGVLGGLAGERGLRGVAVREQVGAAKDFVVSRTFYSVSSGWRLLSASQRTNTSSSSSSFASYPSVLPGPCPSLAPESSLHSPVRPSPPVLLSLRALLSQGTS